MATQIEFRDEMVDGIMDWLEMWEGVQHSKPRSDWIIYTLMLLAGSILKSAPPEMRAGVLLEALGTFGDASGARVDQFMVEHEPHTVN